jgi:putative FmdB family regulatory protein
MPTYEYACEKCGHQFDIVQPIADAALTQCPKELCGRKRWGKGRVKRRISTGGGLLFKGSGFYTTDYRSQGYQDAAKKDSAPATPATPATPAAPAAGESKPAVKPAAKPEAKTTKPKAGPV